MASLALSLVSRQCSFPNFTNHRQKHTNIYFSVYKYFREKLKLYLLINYFSCELRNNVKLDISKTATVEV